MPGPSTEGLCRYLTIPAPHNRIPGAYWLCRHNAGAKPLPVGAERTTVEPKQIDIIMVGGITKPGEAEWIDDDTALPDLPMVREPNSSQQKS